MSDAADKLARTRLAIIAHLQARERRHERNDLDLGGEEPAQEQAAQPPRRRRARDRGGRGGVAAWLGRARRVMRTWWRHHPASMGVDLARPALTSYATRQPLQYLGLAALAGSVVMLTRPWRLISGTGLLLALLKSSQLSSLVMSAMAGADYGSADEPPA